MRIALYGGEGTSQHFSINDNTILLEHGQWIGYKSTLTLPLYENYNQFLSDVDEDKMKEIIDGVQEEQLLTEHPIGDTHVQGDLNDEKNRNTESNTNVDEIKEDEKEDEKSIKEEIIEEETEKGFETTSTSGEDEIENSKKSEETKEETIILPLESFESKKQLKAYALTLNVKLNATKKMESMYADMLKELNK